MFESDLELYELILSACNQKEEEEWKSHLLELSSSQRYYSADDISRVRQQFSILNLDIKAVGKVLGPPGTLVRRVSMQRAATVGSRSNAGQVIIRNTYSSKDQGKSPSSTESGVIGRSQSVLYANPRVPILAPRRVERVQIEHDMSEVWTKELLPYPGIGPHNLDQQLRMSASSMLRKLGKSSLASSLSKRSTSHPGKEKGEMAKESDARNQKFERPYPAHELTPVIESPLGSRAGNHDSFHFDGATDAPNSKDRPKRSASTLSKIKRRVSEVGIGRGSKNDGEDNPGSQSLKSRWSTPKISSALSQSISRAPR